MKLWMNHFIPNLLCAFGAYLIVWFAFNVFTSITFEPVAGAGVALLCAFVFTAFDVRRHKRWAE